MHDLAFVLAGFLVGAVVGLTGVGGGSLMTPILIFFFGVKPYLAIGTDLLFAAFTKLGGTVRMARARQVEWRVVAHISAGSLPAAVATLWFLNHIGPSTTQTQALMTTTLGGALLLTAAATLYKALRGGPARSTAAQGTAATQPRHWILPPLLGAVIGVLVTLTSVGAGAIGLTVLLLLYPLLPLRRLVGADIAIAVPLTLLAGLGHAVLGSVDWPMLGWLLTGSLPGIWLGTQLGARMPERLVRALLSMLLGYAGLRLVGA